MKRILLMSLLAISTALSAQKPVELEIREQPDFQCQ